MVRLRPLAPLMVILLGGCIYFQPPRLGLSATTIAIGENSWATLKVRNDGGHTLEWSISDDQGWLDLINFDGSLVGELGVGERATIHLSIDRNSVETAPESYQATVSVASNGGNAVVPITMTVRPDTATDLCPASSMVSAAPQVPPDLSADRGPYVAGQLLVRFKDSHELALQGAGAYASAVAAEFGMQLLRSGGGLRADLLTLPAGSDPEQAATALADDPRVRYAEPNYYLHLQVVPNDPDLGLQWPLCKFGLPAAWDVTAGVDDGSAKTIIAIIDSGTDTDHEDLIAKMLPGHDFCATADCGGVDADPNSLVHHGTHVAGIAAAAGDNASGVAGVAHQGVRILPVKVFPDDPRFFATVSSLVDGILWSVGEDVPGQLFANSNPARILNMSLGGPIISQALNDAVQVARSNGALVFAASGNTGAGDFLALDGILAPANAPGATPVGSVNSNFQRSSFSMFDVTGGPSVAFLAPGGLDLDDDTAVFSTFRNDGYGYFSGTSMATPFVAGVAALIWSAEPGLTDDQVLDRLRSSTYFENGWDALEYGAGVLCADLALGLASTCGQ